MISKPMLFSGEMVRAILDGRKSQTRRLLKPQPGDVQMHELPKTDPVEGWQIPGRSGVWNDDDATSRRWKCPHPIGSRIWVKETFRLINDPATCIGDALDIDYRADGKDRIMDKLGRGEWKPSIFMPRWASRITLEVTDVRVQRLQEISEEDARAEGVKRWLGDEGKSFINEAWVSAYITLWNSINGKGSWDKNPWCFCYTFKRIKP